MSQPAPAPKPRVFLALPSYGGGPASWRVAVAGTLDATRGACEVTRSVAESSLLASGFNGLWCDALNNRGRAGLTHFAMLHSDILPEPGWLDTLLGEIRGHDADLVSAVVPIKDERGLTSTAVDDPVNPWRVLRRLTLKEVHRLPETFGAKEAGHCGRRLLVNTGCFVCRLDAAWCETAHFEIRDRIVRDAAGKFVAENIPEDWGFSRHVQERGGRVLATRKVRLAHRGPFHFANDRPWGSWESDRGAFA